MDVAKIKIMSNMEGKFELERRELENMFEYCYLVQTVNFNERGKLELRARTTKTWKNFWA